MKRIVIIAEMDLFQSAIKMVTLKEYVLLYTPKENVCSECGKELRLKINKRCQRCWFDLIRKKYFCEDCGVIVSDCYSKKCRKCFLKNKERIYYCKDCKIVIKNKNSDRCRKCWKINNKLHPNKNINVLGDKNYQWKGDSVGYWGLHQWVRRHKPQSNICEHCHQVKNKLVVANISGKYKRDINDFKWLCPKCHNYYDGTIENLKYNRKKEVKNLMAKISDFVKASGNFLSAKDVIATPTAVFVIISEGKVVINEKFKNEKLQLEGEYDKIPKTFDLSKTNARVIADKLGDDTVKWIGHQLILETYRTKTTDGKMTDAINVKEVR